MAIQQKPTTAGQQAARPAATGVGAQQPQRTNPAQATRPAATGTGPVAQKGVNTGAVVGAQGQRAAATSRDTAASSHTRVTERPQRAASSTAVAKPQTTAIATRGDMPDYIKQAQRGSENVDMQDLVIPRIELVQALSPCIEEGNAQFIEGARPGMFYNSVTRELYGPSLIVCPAFFKKQYLCWRDRKMGGGFGGAFDSMAEAQDRIAQEDMRSQDDWEAVETAIQIVLVYNPETQDMSEAVISMARTKMKVSRQWNSLIRVNGMDRFSRIYEIFGVDEENSQNQSYKNLAVRYIEWAPMEVYKAAEKLYNSIASGERKVKIDDNYEDDAIPGVATAGVDAGSEGATEY